MFKSDDSDLEKKNELDGLMTDRLSRKKVYILLSGNLVGLKWMDRYRRAEYDMRSLSREKYKYSTVANIMTYDTHRHLLVKEVVFQAKDGRQLLSGAFHLPVDVCGLRSAVLV